MFSLNKNRIKNRWFSQIAIFLVMFLSLTLLTQGGQVAAAQDQQVNIYLFWGEGCPHCAAAKPVLEAIALDNPQVNFFDFEVYNHREYIDLFLAFGEAYNFEPRYVPTIFAGEKYWEGYSESIGVEIEKYVSVCLLEGCEDPGEVIMQEFTSGPVATAEEPTLAPGAPTETLGATPSPTAALTQTPALTATPSSTPAPALTESHQPGEDPGANSISLPLIGTIDLAERSLLVSTLLLSFVDGFNPCSVWVLSMLLAITLNTRSRKKVLIIGLVFIFVTGLIYALFIGGLFTVLKVVQFIGWIQVVVSLVALFFGLVNIKDYFWYKEGLSFTIDDKKKPGIYKAIRRVLNADDSTWMLIGSTVILAAGVSLVEFSCTAGFPVLWTNLLSAQGVSSLAFLGFLFVYMVVYQIDELAIFLVSVCTLRKTKVEEKHGRILKLLGGMLMLTLAAVMLFDPALMNDLLNALVIFGIAFGLTGLVLLVHRVIFPKFNIKLGSANKSD